MSHLKTLCIFGLLLVNYTKTEVDLIGLVEVRRHAHHLRESFFCMVQRAISIVEDADAIPQFRLLHKWLASGRSL